MTEQSPIDMVRDWHRKYQVGFPEKVTLKKEVLELRVKLILEEREELIDAIMASNRVEQLDALCDLQYVIVGAALHLGLGTNWQTYVTLVELRRSALFQCQVIVDALVQRLGFSLVFEDAFRRVHENNNAKMWSADEMVFMDND